MLIEKPQCLIESVEVWAVVSLRLGYLVIMTVAKKGLII
jgi:hypothetical protein